MEMKMDRLKAFEAMLADIRKQEEYEKEQIDRLKAEGREKTASYRQYFGNRLFYRKIMDKYRECGLLD
jgi:hypothetical protein